MRYIAKKLKKDSFEIMGLTERETINGDKVEIIIDKKTYSKQTMIETMEAYKAERDGVIEKYNKDIEDMNSMLEAMVSAE